ncbi:disulfide bond formation protein B [Marinibaculum pumilum]|uniref:Disulfide bond formation protein B n=1 Tax=Marinibaculum pumilum TaxID=1766165 RepID=A0ABV7KY01_9PROT
MSTSLLRNLNALAGLGIAGVLAFALIWQIVLAELPCPLCLLQRLAFVAIGFGICLNIAGGLRPSHFGVILLGALFGVLTSSRQVLLHIVPGSGHYGAPFLGMHFYSWALILFLAVILLVALVLFLFGGAIAEAAAAPTPPAMDWLGRIAFIAIAAMAVVTLLAAFAECGVNQCPDNPTSYWLFG